MQIQIQSQIHYTREGTECLLTHILGGESSIDVAKYKYEAKCKCKHKYKYKYKFNFVGCILNSVTEAKDKCSPETGLRAFLTTLYVAIHPQKCSCYN